MTDFKAQRTTLLNAVDKKMQHANKEQDLAVSNMEQQTSQFEHDIKEITTLNEDAIYMAAAVIGNEL